MEQLDQTAEKLRQKTEMSHARLAKSAEAVQNAMKKLETIRNQLSVITSRVNELKKIACSPQPAAPAETPVKV